MRILAVIREKLQTSVPPLFSHCLAVCSKTQFRRSQCFSIFARMLELKKRLRRARAVPAESKNDKEPLMTLRKVSQKCWNHYRSCNCVPLVHFQTANGRIEQGSPWINRPDPMLVVLSSLTICVRRRNTLDVFLTSNRCLFDEAVQRVKYGRFTNGPKRFAAHFNT